MIKSQLYILSEDFIWNISIKHLTISFFQQFLSLSSSASPCWSPMLPTPATRVSQGCPQCCPLPARPRHAPSAGAPVAPPCPTWDNPHTGERWVFNPLSVPNSHFFFLHSLSKWDNFKIKPFCPQNKKAACK